MKKLILFPLFWTRTLPKKTKSSIASSFKGKFIFSFFYHGKIFSLLPRVSELLLEKEIAKAKRNDKKNLVKEREALGLRKTPNPFIMFGIELREKMKGEKINIQGIKAAWEKLSDKQLVS